MIREVLVVVPAWNEEASIETVVRDLKLIDLDVLVVDDGSTDKTSLRAKETGAEVITLPFNLGVGAALRCGFRFAVLNGYQIVIQCDADGQHPVEHIPKLLEALKTSNADMVIGSRFAQSMELTMTISRARRFAMKLLSWAATSATNTSVTDSTSGFRAIRIPLLSHLSNDMPSYYLGDTFEVVVAAGKAGYSVTEIHVPIKERVHGVSTASTIHALRMTTKILLVSLLGIHFRLPKQVKTTPPISIESDQKVTK